MKILITGASGFIGSSIADEGLQRGLQVWAGLRRNSSKQYLQNPSLRFAELDFSHKEVLQKQLQQHCSSYGKWDCIVHCAGATKCRRMEDFYTVNYEATRNFVETLILLDMVPARFIYMSSLSVFGPVKEQPPYMPIGENDIPAPDTAYGKSKLMSEQYLQSLPDFPYVILRPTGVYGPRERDYFMMAQSIRKHIDFSVGYRQQLLTFIYVKDLVKALFLVIEQQPLRRCYFVSDGGCYSSRSFIDYLQKELNKRWVIHIKAPLFVLKIISLCAEWGAALTGSISTLNRDKYKIMKQRNWQCDISPLVNELGFSADYDLQRGVRETIAWYKKEGWL